MNCCLSPPRKCGISKVALQLSELMLFLFFIANPTRMIWINLKIFLFPVSKKECFATIKRKPQKPIGSYIHLKKKKNLLHISFIVFMSFFFLKKVFPSTCILRKKKKKRLRIKILFARWHHPFEESKLVFFISAAFITELNFCHSRKPLNGFCSQWNDSTLRWISD